MPSLTHIDNLEQMEQEQKWEEIRLMLLEQWNADRSNVGVALRLATECWYVLVEWLHSIEYEKLNLDYDAFQNTLMQVTKYGLENYIDSYDYLWISGYMISQFPYLFYVDETNSRYDEMKEFGYSLFQKAIQLNANDVIAARTVKQSKIYNGDFEPPIKMDILNEMFPENTEMEQYFKEIFGYEYH